nr:hypothetical protein [Kribbella catacumbae]
MRADPERHPDTATSSSELADQIPPRANVHRVPRLMAGIEVVEVVVMIGEGHEVPRAEPGEVLQQRVRVELGRLPLTDDVLESFSMEVHVPATE